MRKARNGPESVGVRLLWIVDSWPALGNIHLGFERDYVRKMEVWEYGATLDSTYQALRAILNVKPDFLYNEFLPQNKTKLIHFLRKHILWDSGREGVVQTLGNQYKGTFLAEAVEPTLYATLCGLKLGRILVSRKEDRTAEKFKKKLTLQETEELFGEKSSSVAGFLYNKSKTIFGDQFSMSTVWCLVDSCNIAEELLKDKKNWGEQDKKELYKKAEQFVKACAKPSAEKVEGFAVKPSEKFYRSCVTYFAIRLGQEVAADYLKDQTQNILTFLGQCRSAGFPGEPANIVHGRLILGGIIGLLSTEKGVELDKRKLFNDYGINIDEIGWTARVSVRKDLLPAYAPGGVPNVYSIRLATDIESILRAHFHVAPSELRTEQPEVREAMFDFLKKRYDEKEGGFRAYRSEDPMWRLKPFTIYGSLTQDECQRKFILGPRQKESMSLLASAATLLSKKVENVAPKLPALLWFADLEHVRKTGGSFIQGYKFAAGPEMPEMPILDCVLQWDDKTEPSEQLVKILDETVTEYGGLPLEDLCHQARQTYSSLNLEMYAPLDPLKVYSSTRG